MNKVKIDDYIKMMDDVNISEETTNKLLQIPMFVEKNKKDIIKDDGINNSLNNNIIQFEDTDYSSESDEGFWVNLNRGKVFKRNIYRAVAASVGLFLICGVTFTSYRLLNNKKSFKNDMKKEEIRKDELVDDINKKDLGESYEKISYVINETQKFTNYEVTFLSIANKKGLESYNLSGKFNENKLYCLISIKAINGKKITSANEIEYSVLPTLQGSMPHTVENLKLKTTQELKDGVLYITFEEDGLNILDGNSGYYERLVVEKDFVVADKLDDVVAPYKLNGNGEIKQNTEYKGVNALFSIPDERIEKLPDKRTFFTQKYEWLKDRNPARCDEIFNNIIFAMGEYNGLSDNKKALDNLDFYSLDGTRLCQTIDVKSFMEIGDNGDYRYYVSGDKFVLILENKDTSEIGFIVIDKDQNVVEKNKIKMDNVRCSEYILILDTRKIVEVKQVLEQIVISSYDFDGKNEKTLYSNDVSVKKRNGIISHLNLDIKDKNIITFYGSSDNIDESTGKLYEVYGYYNISDNKFIYKMNDEEKVFGG